MATEGVGAPLSPPGTSSPRRVSTSSAPSADDDIVELPKENRPKDKGPALDGGRAGASELPVLAKTEGGLVLVGPGLVVASSIPDLDDDDTDWSARALSAPNRPAPTLAIFVVRFDTKHGNTVEWCYPEDADVDGVEFSCLPSGAHNIHEDVIYFRNGPFYGVAAFGRAAGAIEDERGSRLRAVGLLSPSFVGLAGHVAFLRSRVRHALRWPGDYAELVPYYEATRSDEEMPRLARNQPDFVLEEDENPGSSSSAPAIAPEREAPQPAVPQILQELPPGELATFVDYFGPQVFLIWKNVLAQKRILYYSPPPVVSLTHHVLSTCTLAASFLPQHEIPTNPAFYINLNDISYFSPLPHYVACTTDSVILSKPQYYDLFLDHGVPVAGGPPIGGLGSNIAPPPRYFLTDLDRTRYRELRRIINETAREGETKPKKAFGGASASDSRTRLVVEATDDVSQADSGFSEGRQPDEAERERIERADHAMALEMERLTDTRIAKYFATLNTRLFRHLTEIAARPDPTVRPADYAHMGLDRRNDHHFLTDIVDLYGFDVVIEPPPAGLQQVAALVGKVRHGCVRGVSAVAAGCWRAAGGVVHAAGNAVNSARGAVGGCFGRAEGELRI